MTALSNSLGTLSFFAFCEAAPAIGFFVVCVVLSVEVVVVVVVSLVWCCVFLGFACDQPGPAATDFCSDFFDFESVDCCCAVASFDNCGRLVLDGVGGGTFSDVVRLMGKEQVVKNTLEPEQECVFQTAFAGLPRFLSLVDEALFVFSLSAMLDILSREALHPKNVRDKSDPHISTMHIGAKQDKGFSVVA